MELARAPRKETRPIAVQKQKSYEYTITYAPLELARRKISFSSKEIRHLTVASLLVMGVGLSSGMFLEVYTEIWDPIVLVMSIVILALSFLMHEIAHKIAAQRNGLWAEFRLTLMGAILTLFSVVSPIKIISPGAVMVAGSADRKALGKISIAGPVTNITLSTVFFAAAFLPSQYALIILFGAAINAWIAFFNLIPFGLLDGFKVFLWNKSIWALVFTASLILTIISYTFVV